MFRSSKHIYAQVIDDVKGMTVAAASTLDEETKKALTKGKGTDKDAAAVVGKLVAAAREEGRRHATSSSIAAVTSITAGSRHSAMRPAKAA